MKTQKLLLLVCVLHFAFCINSNAQIQHNNIRVVDTIYTPAGYPGAPLHAILWLPSVTNGAAIVLTHPSATEYNSDEIRIQGDFFSSYGYVVVAIDYYGFFHPSG